MRAHEREQGFTLVEVLVSIVLLALLVSGVTAIILSLTSTTQNFVASATTQNQASDAISQITRDVSNATVITYADDYRVDFATAENNTTAIISYFYWAPDGSGPPVPNGVNTANLPNKPAIIVYRQPAGSLSGTSSVLVTGYDITKQSTVLFTYFNKANQDMVTPITGSNLNSIERIQYQFALKVVNRNTLIQLASSATPRYSATAINNGGVGASTVFACLAPTLSGSLPPTTTTANLVWTTNSNANTYTLYRENPNQAVDPQVVAVLNGSGSTSYLDSTVKYGEKYTYYVVAGCAIGTSPASNNVQLSVTPPAVTIVNFNTTKNLTDVKSTTSTPLLTDAQGRSYAASEPSTYNPDTGTTYTVARGLTNQITWAVANGAEGYLVYRNGTQIANVSATTHSYQDTTNAYGDTTSYNVVAYNTGQNGSGGNGPASATAQLISPPAASSFSVTAQSTSTNSTTSSNVLNITSQAANTTGFTVQSNSTSAASASCAAAASSAPISALTFTGSSVTDTSINWGSSTCYIITGYNDAGAGAPSAGELASQMPGTFSIVNAYDTSLRNQISEYFSLNASTNGAPAAFTVVWSSATGAASYSSHKVITASAGSYIDAADQTDNVGTSTSINYGNVTPGTDYTLTVTATAANGSSRAVSLDYVSAPDLPARADSIIQASTYSAPYFRRVVQIYGYTNHGMASYVGGRAWFDYQGVPGYSYFGAANTTYRAYSNGGACSNAGDTGASVDSVLYYNSYGKVSYELGWKGRVSGGYGSVSGPCASDVAQSNYYAGHNAYYTAQ